MRFLLKLLLLFAYIFLPTIYCEAATTPRGASGVINVPSAYVAKPWQASIGYFNVKKGDHISGNLSFPFGVELAYSRWRPDFGREKNLYSIKTNVLQEKILKPAVAIGVEDITDNYDRSFYMVASKQMPFGLRLHMGARTGHKVEGLFFGLEKEVRLKGDLKKQLPFIPVFNVMLEYDGNNLNYGAYIRNSRGLRFDLAWHDDSFRAGIQFEF